MLTPFEVALREEGIKEIPGSKSNPRIVEYHQHTSLKADDEAVPWCAAFICWCIDKAHEYGWIGSSSTNKATARSYLTWGVSSRKNPAKGDIAIFSRGTSKTSGHVTFFCEYTKFGVMVKCYGGNQGDAVCYAEYPRWRLLDIRRSV